MTLSIAIPSYRRGAVLLETLERIQALEAAPAEVLVIDQTERHPEEVARRLGALARDGAIRWIHLERPSIPRAMNCGLLESRQPFVLFLDDDVVPAPDLLERHLEALERQPGVLVAGQVLRPGEEPEPLEGARFRFRSSIRQGLEEFMGGNFSLPRRAALALGGFDENFRGAAYRFEAEFSRRWLEAGYPIWFEPAASVVHLQVPSGGVRSFGDHRRTLRPSHAVGEYYYWLTTPQRKIPWGAVLGRPFRAVRTRSHLRRPWWIPGTLLAELLGFLWAAALALRGPRRLSGEEARRCR